MKARVTGCLGALAMVASGGVYAQVNLATFLNNTDATVTPLQRSVGNAIQATCGALGSAGVNQPSILQSDLYLRCNELVESARVLQGVDPDSTAADRSLFTQRGPANETRLLNLLQQYSGEEVAARGVLATRVSSDRLPTSADD